MEFKNTGQYGTNYIGIDINYCNARNITTGNSDITVAVVDNGIQKNHPDIINLHSFSYDVDNGNSPSQLYAGNHGTSVAGIIGANANNGIGVAGIAPNCKLMDISFAPSVSVLSRIKRADGIQKAWRNGASVISNSWFSDGSQHIEINDAIDSALQRGRGRKGCVVVFCTGNSNTDVYYPADYYGVIAVGAIFPYGQRLTQSNYGIHLDIVAPGYEIPTTLSNGNYTTGFGQTSSACPHIAGVAALVLSVNPNLYQWEVRNIIESTARKVRDDVYNYTNTSGRPNGTWNNEMGYGLVDAYEALKKTLCTLPNVTFSKNVTVSEIVNGNNITIQNTTINTGAIVKINACNDINVYSATVMSGATLEIEAGGSFKGYENIKIMEGAIFIIK